MTTILAIVFAVSAGLLVYAQIGYGLLLLLISRVRRARQTVPLQETPDVSVIVAAYKEQSVIQAKVKNLRSLDWPKGRLEVIVSVDGAVDATAARARKAGADLVIENERGGKIRAQDEGVRQARGEIVAFSDANSVWERDALRELVKPFGDERVGYVCGQVQFLNAEGDNQEGLYWRYEMALRAMESRLSSVTGGNGAIYATRKEAYIEVDPVMGHDLSFPFNMVKRGWRAVYAPAARATEKMVPSIEGEFARKRRMMSHAWPIVLRGGLLSPRGYSPLYALMIGSHRILRYLTPFLHLVAFGSNIALIALSASPVWAATFAAQFMLLFAAAAASLVPSKLFLVARYYVSTTASIALGLWDWLRHGTEAGWEPAEGTR